MKIKALNPVPALAAAFALSGCAPEAFEPGSTVDRTLPVQVYLVAPRDLSRSVQVSAPVESLTTVRLAAQTSGVVTRVHVETGDLVSSGDVIAELDVREAEAELAQARANLAEQQVNYERLARLSSEGFVDAASFEVARTRVDSAQATVQLWQTRVDFGRVMATLNGVVTARHVEPGEAVSQYAPLVTLADMESLIVRFGLSELDVASLTPGMPVPVTIDALPDSPQLAATIRRIAPTTEGPSRLVAVEVALPADAHARVRLGYLARATIAVDQRPGVLAIPLGAVAIDAAGSFVMVVDEDLRLARRTVEPGLARGEWREVVSGLKVGDAIVTSNPADLIEGERVRVVSRLDGDVS
jgi:membrane fusion protein, multidrug efflux system